MGDSEITAARNFAYGAGGYFPASMLYLSQVSTLTIL